MERKLRIDRLPSSGDETATAKRKKREKGEQNRKYDGSKAGHRYTSIYVGANNTESGIDKTGSRIEKLLFNPVRSERTNVVYEPIQGRIMGVCAGINHWTPTCTRHRHGSLHLHARFTRVDTDQGRTRACNFEPPRTYAARTLIDPILRFVTPLVPHLAFTAPGIRGGGHRVIILRLENWGMDLCPVIRSLSLFLSLFHKNIECRYIFYARSAYSITCESLQFKRNYRFFSTLAENNLISLFIYLLEHHI